MLTTSAILVIAGAASLLLGGFMLYHAVPREGKAETAWTKTSARATSTTMVVLLLLLAGATMLVKGIF